MTTIANIAAAHARLSANLRGALWMLLSAGTFTAMTTLVKFLGDDYSPALQTFYRQATALLLMSPLILRNPKAAFVSTRPGLMIYRAAASTVALILAFWTYQAMPLAEANALSFTRTLWIVPLAIFVLREPVGVWRIGATLIGFGGVLLMLQPGSAGAFGLPAFAALASAAIFATTITSAKMVTRENSLLTLVTWSVVLGVVFSAPMALMEWRWPTPGDLALLCLMGALGLVNQTFYMKGMSIGDAAAMAPIDYTRLLFATTIGFVGFHEVPNALTMTGAAIVIASTLVITLREARAKKAPPPTDE